MREIVAGVDIGGTNTAFALVDRKGELLAENKLITTDYPEIEYFVSE